MSALTYDWNAGLSEDVECVFDSTDDGVCLDAAYVAGVNVYDLLSPKQIEHIEWLAECHFQRQRDLRGGPDLVGLRPLETV